MPSDSASRNGSRPDGASTTIQRLVVLGYITAIGMPPIGLILGGLLALGPGNTKSKHWPWIVAASIIGALIWWAIISSGALTATNQGY